MTTSTGHTVRPLPSELKIIEVPSPAQQRSVDAMKRLLRAGEELLADNAFEEASISKIASLAESSVGSFYRILGDKDALTLILIQGFFEELYNHLVALEESRDSQDNLADFAERLADTLVKAYTGRGGVLRAIILRASRSLEFRAKVHRLNDFISSTAVACAQPHRSEIQHPKGIKAAAYAAHMAVGVLNQHTVTGSLGGLKTHALRKEIKRLILNYLTQP